MKTLGAVAGGLVIAAIMAGFCWVLVRLTADLPDFERCLFVGSVFGFVLFGWLHIGRRSAGGRR